ncbi:hypothetical protein [Pedobacter sp. MC2016-24]|uniref:hypothetical protein n=1 Tax=Pedobacter sp. MC2016-24 TaxID=2780090 RepID=UPI001881CF6E|nr:hypothetical protein [Pedobacter sp. MC2016-24]MBE9598685.1 hypothetical protein [Pedobacter sp. MC2016-24]
MEFQFQNFQNEYNAYHNIEGRIHIALQNNVANIPKTQQLRLIYDEFQNLDVKMRLAFGIREIRLNNEFVQDKEGDLKICHLLYYKLADLWFAYETFIKLFGHIAGVTKHKINWIGTAVHNNYPVDPILVNTLNIANSAFGVLYNTANKRTELIEYLNYCLPNAFGAQRVGLSAIIAKISFGPFILTHTEVLTVMYAIRNNFVHNGETTVVPAIFGYRNKARLLEILYPYLSLLLLRSTNIACVGL